MEIGKLNKLDLIGNYSQRDGEEMQTIGITVIFTKSYFCLCFCITARTQRIPDQRCFFFHRH